MDEKLKEEAIEMMNILGEKSQGLMGLSADETCYFDILLWLFGEGEKPEID